jgi:hypothetical protein
MILLDAGNSILRSVSFPDEIGGRSRIEDGGGVREISWVARSAREIPPL